MANRTAKYARSIHGTNPQYLIEKIVRERIHNCRYWQEECFLLNSALVLERAVDDLKYVGGTYGVKVDPTPFLCLVLKMLQIQPQKEIVYLYIDQPDFKYLRALGAFYLRLTGRPVEVYEKLEPLYNDYRKLRVMDNQRKFSVIHMDEFIDNLLRDEKVFNISLPRLTKRIVIEDNREIEPYRSKLEEENLIPKEPIRDEAKDSRKKDSDRYRCEKPPTDRRHDSSSSYGRSSYDKRDHHSRHSHHRDERRYHDDDRRSRDSRRYRDQDRVERRYPHDGRRSRSRSPRRHQEEKKPASSYAGSSTRFSQQEIDNENAIRARVGLKPLR